MSTPDEVVSAIDTSWVPEGHKLFLVFDFDTQRWHAAVRLRSDYLRYIATADSSAMSVALLEVRRKVREKVGEAV